MARLQFCTLLLVVGALLCLAACDSATTALATATLAFTALLTVTPTATLIPAPTPSSVPDGPSMMEGQHFGFAYPADLKPCNQPTKDIPGALTYFLMQPNGRAAAVRLTIYSQAPRNHLDAYCLPVSADNQHVTLAGLPMTYALRGQSLRAVYFANSQYTTYSLLASVAASDAGEELTTQAADDAILATFTSDVATPLSC